LSHRTAAPTESDIKRMDQVVAQAEIDENWESLMVAGPIVVNYLGNLMVRSFLLLLLRLTSFCFFMIGTSKQEGFFIYSTVKLSISLHTISGLV
jgi:hypothetical protein